MNQGKRNEDFLIMRNKIKQDRGVRVKRTVLVMDERLYQVEKLIGFMDFSY